MGYADELAKMTKTKQQIKEEELARETILRNAWYKAFPDLVEDSASHILFQCTKAAKEGEHSYRSKNPKPTLPHVFPSEFDKIPYIRFETEDLQVLKAASVYYEVHNHTCRKEFLDALVARLKKEGFRVRLSMFSDDPINTLLFGHERDAFLTVRW